MASLRAASLALRTRCGGRTTIPGSNMLQRGSRGFRARTLAARPPRRLAERRAMRGRRQRPAAARGENKICPPPLRPGLHFAHPRPSKRANRSFRVAGGVWKPLASGVTIPKAGGGPNVGWPRRRRVRSGDAPALRGRARLGAGHERPAFPASGPEDFHARGARIAAIGGSGKPFPLSFRRRAACALANRARPAPLFEISHASRPRPAGASAYADPPPSPAARPLDPSPSRPYPPLNRFKPTTSG